jgi:rfaE bifunctional protein nucleotidyltransferase chain/domain
MPNKLVSPADIPRTGSIVLCQGCFDLLHIGHIKYLEAAKQLGEILVVAVTSDRFVNKGPGRPFFHEQLRMEQLAALECVDFVVLSDTPNAVPIIEALRPAIYAKGKEYENLAADVTGNIQREKDTIEACGGQIVFVDQPTQSSSSLLNKATNLLSPELKVFLEQSPVRAQDIDELFTHFANLKVLVVGETILDKYSFVEATNIATARHLLPCCAEVALLTAVAPSVCALIGKQLPKLNLFPIIIPEIDTIIKERYLDDKNKQLLRVDFGSDQPLATAQRAIRAAIEHSGADIILVNDFGHGLISKDTAQWLAAQPKFLALNVQTNSLNKGFNLVTKYSSASFISIDVPEAQLALMDKEPDIQRLGHMFSKRVPNTMLALTHGRNGATVFNQDAVVHVPALVNEIIDATGAGDAFLAFSSLCAFLKASPALTGFIGNAAGAKAARILGNERGIEKIELLQFIRTILK